MADLIPYLTAQTQRQLALPMELVLYHHNQVVAQWTFDIPPTRIEYLEPLRVNAQQGLRSAFAQRFGGALPQVTIQWTTSTGPSALRAGSADPDGYAHFLRLVQQVFRGYYNETVSDLYGTWSLHLYDYPHQQYLIVVPLSNDWVHAVPENLAMSTTLTFLVLGTLTNPPNPPRTTLQSTFLDTPAQWVQHAAQTAYTQATALGGYLNPSNLTSMQQGLWPTLPYYTQWQGPDYQEWFGNPAITPATTQGLVQFATQTVPAVLEPILTQPSIPYPVSLANLQQTVATANQWTQTLQAITPYPYWVGTLTSRLSTYLQTLPILPQVFEP